jgi:predicted amidohydrolase
MKIAALQMQAETGNVEANLFRISRAAQDAAAQGVKLLIAPELATTGYGAGEAFSKLSSPAGGEIQQKIALIARENHIAIASGFAERDGDAVYNSAVFTDGDEINAIYRKSHLFGDYERQWFRPEKPSSVLVEFGGMKIAMLICYDVEFPENVRRLALAGADLIAVPTALPKGPSGQFIAQHMIRTRAFENQLFIAYVNHCGGDGVFDYAGLSCIAASDGSLMAQAPDDHEALIVADINPADFGKSREENSYLADLSRMV